MRYSPRCTNMTFAWDKANNERNLSAGRSINHFEVWLWLLGDEGR